MMNGFTSCFAVGRLRIKRRANSFNLNVPSCVGYRNIWQTQLENALVQLLVRHIVQFHFVGGSLGGGDILKLFNLENVARLCRKKIGCN